MTWRLTLNYLLFYSLIISTSAFAIDFNKVAGHFEMEKKSIVVNQNKVNLYAERTRAPASERQKRNQNSFMK